jgi:hypothetical protein
MQNALATSGAELTKKVGGVFLFKVAGDGGAQGSWVVDAKNNGGSVRIAKEGIQIVFISTLMKAWSVNGVFFVKQVTREMLPSA